MDRREWEKLEKKGKQRERERERERREAGLDWRESA